MRDYPTLRKSASVAVLYFPDTVGSSTIRITYTLKWLRNDPKPVVEQHILLPLINATSSHLCCFAVSRSPAISLKKHDLDDKQINVRNELI